VRVGLFNSAIELGILSAKTKGRKRSLIWLFYFQRCEKDFHFFQLWETIWSFFKSSIIENLSHEP